MQRKKQKGISQISSPSVKTALENSNVAVNVNTIDLKTFALAVGLRIITTLFLTDYLARSPEFVTPWNSFKRIKEAVHMIDEYKISPYDGDSFHLMPLFLKVVGPFTYLPHAYIVLSIAMDIFAGIVLQFAAQMYLRRQTGIKEIDAERYSKYVALMYLFNPMTIGSCAIGSISTLSNFIIALFIKTLFNKQITLASIFATLAIFIYPYYLVLLAPLIVVAKKQWLTATSVIFASSGALFAFNCLIEHATKFLPDTFGFFWNVLDLSPNVGVFWYFFVFIFDQYRQFFQWTFQLTAILPAIPLAMTLKKEPAVLVFACLGHVAVLSSYPSYAEAAILLALFPMFPQLLRYSRYTLIGFGSIVASFVLSPIMWRMWMITGSGNANFYFAIIIVYVVALSFLIVDIMYNYARFEFSEQCAKEGILNPEKIPEEFAIQGVIPFIPGVETNLKLL
uniref:Phosphatidylinositol glycan anchor biosynthesis class U protein n=1 Tax=Panagrolaimus superbus TaxID=310955 RepID=A0A914YFE6_9BILA